MSKTMIMDHPLVQHKVSLLRNKNTGTKEFKELVCELATLLCYEATRDLPTEEVEIETPIAVAKTRMLSGRKLALVPILRAGLGMVDGMLALIPAAKVGHIGMYRNEETLEPVEYYCKLPDDIAEREVIVLDPMLATGGSAVDAITQIKKRGAKSIKFIGIIAAPEGMQRLQEAHSDVDIYVAAMDEKLEEKLDLSKKINRQYTEGYRTCLEYQKGKFLEDEWIRRHRKTLSYTRKEPMEQRMFCEERAHVFTNTETILLQQIALAEKIRGEKEKAVEIWELLLKDYGRSRIRMENHFKEVMLIWSNLANTLPDVGKTKEGIALADQGIRMVLEKGRDTS